MVRGAWGLKAGFCRAGTDWGRGGGEGKVMCACVRAGGGIVCVWGGQAVDGLSVKLEAVGDGCVKEGVGGRGGAEGARGGVEAKERENWGGREALSIPSTSLSTHATAPILHRRRGDRRDQGKHGTEGEHEQAHGCTSSPPPPLSRCRSRARVPAPAQPLRGQTWPERRARCGPVGVWVRSIRQCSARRLVWCRSGRAGRSRRQAIRRGSGGGKEGGGAGWAGGGGRDGAGRGDGGSQ